jgi:3-oxoacyl-[acyl-carrier-protein] synthase-1
MNSRPQGSPCRLEDLGVICALGRGAQALRDGLLRPHLDSLRQVQGWRPSGPTWLATVADELPPIPASWLEFQSRNNALALAALQPLLGRIEELTARFGPGRIGVVIGTTTSGVEEATEAIGEFDRSGAMPGGFRYSQLEHGSPARFVAAVAGVQGPAYVISTACSSSAKALASARSLLQLGMCDAVIAGGVDALTRLTIRGFTALEAVAPDRTNPFSRHRRGLNLGEAAALFVLTRASGGIQLIGAGESTDAHHMSAPLPDGAGAERAMALALADAAVSPSEVAYLNLHGTGTPLNDSSEAHAVSRLLGQVPCSSTKPRLGHTLGAAGALELAVCWSLLDPDHLGTELALPPHDFDGDYDPHIPRLDLVEPGRTIRTAGRVVMASNSFGFGGSNCALVVEARVS